MHEHTPFADLTFDGDGATHQAHELLADRQSQSGAGPRLLPRFRLLKMAEQLLLVIQRDARPGVFNFN